ncbi:MAG: mitochondrial fission ELM1 family protein [Alphaproteobacteria bacterium]
MTRPRVQPRVWLLVGDKHGDNAQVDAIGEALAWDCERKRVQVHEPFDVEKPPVSASLHHIDLARSDPLEPPWPDLIVTIGRRPSMVALWVREQSGGRARIALIGKPSGPAEAFDLVIVSGETEIAPLPNVCKITLPLMRANEDAIAAAVESWQGRLAALPRPLIAVLVGGPTGPFIFNERVVDRVVEVATELTADTGGTPYVTTSRRTPDTIVAGLKAKLPSSSPFFEWTPGTTENPYLALLGLADGFVVTGDSISMLVEVIRLRKPVAILKLPFGRMGALDQLRRSLARRLFASGMASAPGAFRQRLVNVVYRSGIVTQTRDFAAFHRLLIERGLAVRAGDKLEAPRGRVPDDMPLAVARITALMENG